jgi:hypothetical protein
MTCGPSGLSICALVAPSTRSEWRFSEGQIDKQADGLLPILPRLEPAFHPTRLVLGTADALYPLYQIDARHDHRAESGRLVARPGLPRLGRPSGHSDNVLKLALIVVLTRPWLW